MSRFFTSTILGLAALTLNLVTSPCLAQQPKVFAPHRPIPPMVGSPIKRDTPPVLRSMVGGLWMTDADFKS